MMLRIVDSTSRWNWGRLPSISQDAAVALDSSQEPQLHLDAEYF